METALNVVRYAGWVLMANEWNKREEHTGGPVLFKRILEVLDREDPDASAALRKGNKPKID